MTSAVRIIPTSWRWETIVPPDVSGPLISTSLGSADECAAAFGQECVQDVSPRARDLLGRVTDRVHAVVDASLDVEAGQTLGLVGESGSGKSTLGRLVLRLIEPDSGTITLDGEDITNLGGRDLRDVRHKMQMVFQDPQSSLDPNWLVRDIIAEPLKAQGRMTSGERETEVRRLLDQVGLAESYMSRYAYEFSGGQRQRIAIARALALEPQLVVCDEPVSALDVSHPGPGVDPARKAPESPRPRLSVHCP